MNRLKSFFKNHKVTLMIIPTADKSIKQMRLNFGIAIVTLAVLAVFNIGLLSATIYKSEQSRMLSSENTELEENLTLTNDKINTLVNINASRASEIEQLKATLDESGVFLETRLEEMDEARTYIAQLVDIFNEQTDSALKAPVSRSSARTAYSDEKTTLEADAESAVLFGEIESLTALDEIEKALGDDSETYSTLVEDLEERIGYLERRPDFYPTSGRLTSGFGYRSDPITGRTSMHNGIDLSNQSGTPIYAAGTGVVTYSNYNGNFGNVIIIDHGNGYETVYAHCKAFSVKAGDAVAKGDLIAATGRSGRTTGTHLHFEIRYHGTPLNPLTILNK